MKALKVDKKWLTDEFYYFEFIGETDDYGSEIYEEPKLIKHCRIEYVSEINRSSLKVDNDTHAIIFCYEKVTAPFKYFRTRSKISILNQEYEIKKVLPYKEPYSNELWSIELEIGQIS